MRLDRASMLQVDAKIAFGKFASVEKLVAESSWCESATENLPDASGD